LSHEYVKDLQAAYHELYQELQELKKKKEKCPHCGKEV